MKIAIHQSPGTPCDPARNLAALRAAAGAAARKGASLLICSEMFLTGYNIGKAIVDLSEPADGASARRVADIARELGIAVLYGYPERSGDEIYNAALFIGRDGQTLANYRKTHLFGPIEKGTFEPGQELMSVDFNGLKVGLLICYDIEFPEAVRTYAVAGIDLVAVPTALMKPYENIARSLVPTRAFENQLFVAYANRCGQEGDIEYCGLSCVCGPDGADIARAGSSEELIVAELNLSDRARAKARFNYINELRPALYKGLTR
jgi:predicted amidohydrolase